MRLTRYALNNPIAVALFYIFVGVLGLTALAQMGRSVLPPVALPVVTIAAPYPGAGPQELERLVIEPIEDELDSTPDLERVSASSQNGVAQIVAQFRFGSNLETDRNNVATAVNAAQPNMPPDLIPPTVSKDDLTQAPILEESVSSSLASPGDLAQTVSRDVVPALRATGGVGTVIVSGSSVRQFTVAPKAGALDALGITSLDVLHAVSGGNDVLPGGVMRDALLESTIGIDAAATSRDSLRNLPLARGAIPALRVADVASVRDDYADRTIVSRVDGDSAILVAVAHAPGEDSLRTIGRVRATFAALSERFPSVRFEELRTDAPSTNASIAGVLQTLVEGIALTVLVTLFFLHAWRNALICACAIPASLCATFAAMWVSGFTIDVLSLMGLSLTIGILVDDSIVIIEAIGTKVALGMHGDEAALAGRKELGGAAFAITLVDVAVFLPIGLMSGIVGEFMREFGLVIVFATAFSLLVSFTLAPLLAARWALRSPRVGFDDFSFVQIRTELRKIAHTFPWTLRTGLALACIAGWHSAVNAFNACERALARRYAERWLPAALKHARVVLAMAGALCALSFVPLFAGLIPTEFSPPIAQGEARVDLMLPPGTPLALTDASAQRFERALIDNPEVKHVETTAGRASNGNAAIFASSVAELGIVLEDPNSSGDDVVALVKSLGALAPNASIAGAGRGMGGTAAISYNVGGDPNTIDVAAMRIANALRANPDATDVRTSDAGLGPRIQIRIDASKAQLLGVSVDDAARTARIATGGDIAMKARLPSGLENVVVRADAAEAGNLEAVRRLSVRSSTGALVPLADVARIEYAKEPLVIVRENRERIVRVSANTAGDAPIGLVTDSISKKLRTPGFLPAGARIEPRGDVAQFLDTVAKMLAALALSGIAVYAILAVLYRSYVLPLVVMLTVPLACVGAFGALFVLNLLRGAFPGVALFASQTLNLYSMLGIVMLVGLVAKNGILLVDFSEKAIATGASARVAIVSAARRRFRPILMTTFAMVAGMLPLALGHTIGAEYRKALGSVVIGGLSSSLFLTLFVVPIVYLGFRARRERRTTGGESRQRYDLHDTRELVRP